MIQEEINLNKKYSILVNHFLFAEGGHIFNNPKYFKIHSKSCKDLYAQLVRKTDKKVYATIAFYEASCGFYLSPKRGTFGGLSLNQSIDFHTIEQFVQRITELLRRQGAKEILLSLEPSAHKPDIFAIVFNVLMRDGFLPINYELNYNLNITNDNFISRIDYGAIKRLRKLERAGFQSKKISHTELSSVYDIISNNRERLGVPMSMRPDQLKEMIDAFPERVHLFATYRTSEYIDMVAAAICFQVAKKIMYVFYWGDVENMQSYSPVVMLASHIYSFCQENNFELMDVGISTLNSEPNYGLINFKRSLGFKESLKLKMRWKI